MMPPVSVIKRGAEATISTGTFLGRKVVFKKRERKGYRNETLDRRLTRIRTRNEVRNIAAARNAGLHVPWIYDVDIAGGLIVMEFLGGERLNTLLYSVGSEDRLGIEMELGKEVARLHSSGIAHGDLTTSNVISVGGLLYFIDFSMATRPADIEAKGVDLRLLKEVFRSSHTEFEKEFRQVIDGYLSEGGDRDVVDKISEIERRARYV